MGHPFNTMLNLKKDQLQYIVFISFSQLFLYKFIIIDQYNMQNHLNTSILNTQNPIISLYILKKSIESELVHQIHINSVLQNLIKPEPPLKCQDYPHIQIEPLDNSTSVKNSPLIRKQRRKKIFNNAKNDTKNISKNFGKAIITFSEQNQQLVRRALLNQNVPYEEFIAALRAKKRDINSIADLRNLWLDGEFPYSRQARIISQFFLKRGSLSYVFSSRITNHEGHIKYRGRLIQVLRHPQEFTYIKTN